MAKKKPETKVPPVVTPAQKATSQARVELPTDEFERVRSAAKSLGLSLTGFMRMAILSHTRKVEKDRE